MANLFLDWTDGDETGISIIDEQHRAIMGFINSFYFYRHDEDIASFLVPTVETMKSFAVVHFHTEERLMRESAYPKYQEHAAEHEKIQTEIWRQERESRQVRDAMGFLFFLKDYWQKHVREYDRQYVMHLRAWLGDQA